MVLKHRPAANPQKMPVSRPRLPRCYIEHLDWQKCVDKYDGPDTLFFLDPPYWQTEHYSVPFPWEEYEAMAKIMTRLKGKAILTINDHPEITTQFRPFRSETVETKYTVDNRSQNKIYREKIYFSW